MGVRQLVCRRMFNSGVVNASSFLKMPLTSQALYFHLGLQADDDGIVDAYSITRMLGVNTDDLRICIKLNHKVGTSIIMMEFFIKTLAGFEE